jgi:hypothetical protein
LLDTDEMRAYEDTHCDDREMPRKSARIAGI